MEFVEENCDTEFKIKNHGLGIFLIVLISCLLLALTRSLGVIEGRNAEMNYDNMLCIIKTEKVELQGHPTFIEEKENNMVAIEIDGVVYIVDKKDLMIRRNHN